MAAPTQNTFSTGTARVPQAGQMSMSSSASIKNGLGETGHKATYASMIDDSSLVCSVKQSRYEQLIPQTSASNKMTQGVSGSSSGNMFTKHSRFTAAEPKMAFASSFGQQAASARSSVVMSATANDDGMEGDFDISNDGSSQVMTDYMDKEVSQEPGKVFEKRDLTMLNGLNVKQDIYGNIIIHGDEFARAISKSEMALMPYNYMFVIEQTAVREYGATALMIDIGFDQLELMDVLVKDNEFELHHSRNPKQPRFLLTKWLDESRAELLPAYANHNIGASAVVIHPDCEHVLMIKERFASPAFQTWKFPGGKVDNGESIITGSQREAFEETGINVSFGGILGIREISSGFRNDTADISMACLMYLNDSTETSLTPCKHELLECRWVNFEELKGVQLHTTAHDTMHMIQQVIRAEDKCKYPDTSQRYNAILRKLKAKSLGQVRSEPSKHTNVYTQRDL